MTRVAAVLALFVLLLAGFLVGTLDLLPQRVASHFGLGGLANGWSSRGAYLAIMLVVGVGIPGLFALVGGWSIRRSPRHVNLPHRDYWLSDERRATTIAWFDRTMQGFGCAIVAFVAWTHWLVIEANRHDPARLDESGLYLGLGLLGAAALVMVAAMLLRFRRPPSTPGRAARGRPR